MCTHDNNNNNTMHKLAFDKETLSKNDQKFRLCNPTESYSTRNFNIFDQILFLYSQIVELPNIYKKTF